MDIAFTQRHRVLALEQTPLEKDVLLLTAFSGQEELSRLFSFQLDMLSSREDIAAKDVVGKKLTFSIKYGDEQVRYFNGFVSRFFASSLTVRGMRLYRAEVVPWLWFLTRTADCRIFQNKTVPQIIEQIFTDHRGVSDYEIAEIKGAHPKRDYCVQYRETDFNFISRLMEQEGIFYWFRHKQGKHTLVLADHKGAYKDLPEKEAEYVSGAQGTLAQSHLWSWEHRHEFLPGKWTQDDYNFETPSTNLCTSTPTVVDLPDMKNYEIYDYPGVYCKRDVGDNLTRLRMEETESAYDVVSVTGSYRSFAPGGKFTLKRHDCPSEEGKTYLITSIRHEAAEPTYVAGEDESERYSNSLTCIPAEVIFRPARLTPKPVVQGPQTAVVVGPGGEEIYTDKYGRVKVQFHWDRYGKNNENSSCWVRVSHPWAGKSWGAIAIPRIGQEVIIDFLEGDPDQPIITGRVYNAEQMPPYALPANATQTGILSRSSKDGSGANCNELRFEDKKGSEQIYLHAEKNQDIEVENDETHWVGHDRKKTIDHDETTHVINNRTETVGGEESITVLKNRTRKVMLNETVGIMLTRTRFVGVNDLVTVGAAQEIGVGGYRLVAVGAYQDVKIGAYLKETIGVNRTEDVGANRTSTVKANDSLTVKGGQKIAVTKDQNVNVTEGRGTTIGKDDNLKVGKNLTIDAGDQVVIKTGKASITMKKDGTITIQGKDITIKGSGEINVKANKDVVIKGKNVLQN